ncbi:hypothetical protein [Geosporobacter ferrireducens]|uniref:Uncharacterized protein n=1 Tax=Geosporobacter ferrireducens TaxID=1424294 RepID=A0A1D8GNW1_9FIRM|nr:hypothetical protein [Geosporobacter ferrireducens]AOT72636.1 hypothetical protein Gferi_25620 [Geosporobacter ferrireducens]MTI55038.1 hypothetical protein [Geosporobacter ferrireducens]
MIYEFMRLMAGKYLRALIDYYIANQNILNTIVVIGGFIWIIFKPKEDKQKNTSKNFFGIEIKEK